MGFDPLPGAPALLSSQLVAWFQSRRRDLPWRTNRSPYRVWLSEVMLQQTRVAVVSDYFLRFVARFPDVKDLAAASEDDVLSLWSGLGYYARGRNLHRAAQAIVADHGGVFPSTSGQLATLPGIGAYTAAAVASLAFGEKVAVLDGNVARVLARLGDDDTPIDTPAGKLRFTAAAQQLVDAHASSADVNEGLMELGALVCTPKQPSCGACPWSSTCAGKERAAVLPVKAKKQERKTLRIACVVLVDDNGRVWLERRASAGLFGGLWEPPGIVLDNDDVEGGWRRCLAERAVVAPTFGPAIQVVRVLTHRELRFEIALVSASSSLSLSSSLGQWFDDRQMKAVGTSTAVRAVLTAARALRLC